MPHNKNEFKEDNIDLEQIPDELRKVIEFEQFPESMLDTLLSIHDVSVNLVRELWNTIPTSAQNILDNFAQFHALISVSQAFTCINFIEESQTIEYPETMSEQEQEDYRAQILDKVLYKCTQDIVKQLKKARRDPILKQDFLAIFKK